MSAPRVVEANPELGWFSIDDMIWLGRRGSLETETTVEIMTHPRKGPGGEILDVPSMEPLVDRLKRLRP